ncbi:MAG: glycoside hydrolase family 31 protein [Lachnospiraceae bacterium]|nr:glycoside hydrolase family 31 protein [Lachnospiraceae bacterium]
MQKEFLFGDKRVRMTAYADNVIRIRVSSDFEESLFDRYNLYRKPEECGEELANGVVSGTLSAAFEDGIVTIHAGNTERKINLLNEEIPAVKDYFNETLGGMRPPQKQIIGEDAKRGYGAVEFQRDPKYFTISGIEDELFYGLGAANTDRIVLNGKTYLERVVYQSNEMPIPFVMTKAGYGVLCNTTFWHGVDVCARDAHEICWYLPDGDIDFTVFAGDKLADILERFTYITGRPALLPKWAYGLAFIDQYTADQYEIMRNAAQFREQKLPCDSISLEPGWMEKRYDFSVDKKWNRQRYLIEEWARTKEPGKTNPKFFTSALKRYGFKLHLWLCCEHDFTAEEERRIGNDVAPEIPDWFDHLKQFICDGASSFKLDPCHTVDNADERRIYANGKGEPEMHNLIQTLYVRDMYRGASEFTGLRPMHHYCGAYTGTGAYSASNTGDNGGRLQTLVWILSCGMSGISNLTCDMEVFQKRTLHYCFFTAWCQLNSWYGFAHPWWAGEEIEPIFAFYDRLRYRLIPYIYSTAITANLTGMPVCRAMPLMYEDKELENAICEYMFGENLLVGAFSDEIYLPAGSRWIDYWNGDVYEGGQNITPVIPEDRGGFLFVRSGAILPTDAPRQYTNPKDTENIILEVYPDGDSSYDFYEDDGLTMEFNNGKRSVAHLTMSEHNGTCVINVGTREGDFTGKGERTYTVRLFASAKPQSVVVGGHSVDVTYDGRYASFEMGSELEAVVTL